MRRIVSASTTGASGLLAIALLALPLIGMNCNASGPDANPLAQPKWECPRPITGAQEAGIGASPEDDGIHLRWTIGDDPDLVGYYIRRRTSDDVIDRLYTTVPLSREELANRGRTMERVDSDVEIGTTYYYVLLAYDPQGNRSMRSDTVSYMLLPKPMQYNPEPGSTVITSRPTFVFGPRETLLNVTTYVIRVTRKTTGEVVWLSPPRTMGYLPSELSTVLYGSGGTVALDSLPPGTYRWRVDLFCGFATESAGAPCGCVYDTARCPGADPSLPSSKDLSFIGSKSGWWEFTVAKP